MWINREEFNRLNDMIVKLSEETARVTNLSFLVGIERSGRENVFTFVRKGEKFEIRTMGLISDNLPKWKEDLLR